MVFLLTCLLWFQQDEIQSELLQNDIVEDRFVEAVQKYNSVQRIESEPLFEQITTTLESREELDDDARYIYTESLKYLGALTFPDGTEGVYEKLIRFDPTYQLTAKDLPPKISAVFAELRARLVGDLRISAADPADGSLLEDAELWVDDQLVGPVYRETIFPVLTGLRRIEIRKTNYDSGFAEIEVLAGQESSYQAIMERNAAELLLITVPGETEVRVDGQLVGTSTQEIPAGLRGVLRQQNIPLENAASLTLNNLQFGEYQIDFDQPCHRTKKTTFNVEALKAYAIASPVILEKAAATISVRAVDEGAGGLLFLDDRRVALLPVENFEVCPGSYTLKVLFPDGEYVKPVTLADEEAVSFVAEPLPSIAWYGVEPGDNGEPPLDLNARLADLTTWNLNLLDPADTSRVSVNPFPILFGDPQISDADRRALSQQKADLYMAARVVRKKVVIRYLEVAFWTPLSQRIQVMQFDFREIDKLEAVLAQMDGFPPLIKPWLGLRTAKLHDVPGCKVLEVNPDGPLAGRIAPDQFVQSFNGAILRDPSPLCDLNAMDPVTLEVDGQSVEVTPSPTIAEVPFDASVLAPQAQLAKFEKLAKYHPDPLVRQSASFNQARYQFFLGDFQKAFDIFSSLSLDATYGINQGTLFYYQGLCFKRLKLPNEARDAFSRVRSYPGATLFDAYGPKAAEWAEAELTGM